MDFLKNNADGAGTSIYQLNQKALGLLAKTWSCGFFVDYPKTENGATRADVEQRGIRPTVSFFTMQLRLLTGVLQSTVEYSRLH